MRRPLRPFATAVWIHEDIPDDTKPVPTNVHSKQYRDMQDELWVALPDANGDGAPDGLYTFANMGNSSPTTPSGAPAPG